jgi:hypothetical protein
MADLREEHRHQPGCTRVGEVRVLSRITWPNPSSSRVQRPHELCDLARSSRKVVGEEDFIQGAEEEGFVQNKRS